MNRRVPILFAALSLAWGIPYLLIKIVVGEISPLSLVLFRTGLGALILLPFALAKGFVPQVLRHWRPVLLYTLVEISVPWWLLSHAEIHLSSSLSGLLIATVPLAGVGVGLVMRRSQALGRAGAAGLAVGLIGVTFLVGVDVEGSSVASVLEVGVVVVFYAFGAFMIGHVLGHLPGLGVVAVSLTFAALIYVPFAVAIPGSLPAVVPSAKVIVALVLLATICTAGAFLLMFALTAEIGPVPASTITYVNPAVAIVAGAVVLHERITWATIVGFALVLLGSVLITRRPRPAAVVPVVSVSARASAPAATVVQHGPGDGSGGVIAGTTILGPDTERAPVPIGCSTATVDPC